MIMSRLACGMRSIGSGLHMATVNRGVGSLPLCIVVAAQLAGCGTPALHCVHVVTTGEQDTYLVALVERGDGLFAGRIHGVEVSFHVEDKELARARTDKLGYATAVGRVPHDAGTLEVRASLDGRGLKAQSHVLLWQSGRPIVICDIDGTVSETDRSALMLHHVDTGSRPLPDAADTLQSLSKQYNLLFMTGRPVFLRDKTHQWLEDHGFPSAPMIMAPDLRDAEDVEPFKQEAISQLKRLYPHALIGIGNAETDSQAYTAENMLAIMIDDGKNRHFRSEAISMRTWKRVRQFFDANQDVLSDPSKLHILVSEGGMLAYPQQPARPAEEK